MTAEETEIAVYGPCNSDGSSHEVWYFRITADARRVIVTPPGFYRDQIQPKVWGFAIDENGREHQVNAFLSRYEPAEFWMA